MRVAVDLSRCDDHGQCAIAAPNVFALDEAGKLVFHDSPDESERANVEDAVDVCPLQAIVLTDR